MSFAYESKLPYAGQVQKGSPEEIAPVRTDGVLVIAIGTVGWLVALVVLTVLHDQLRADGHLWWIACAATGFGLGLVGTVYCARRRG